MLDGSWDLFQRECLPLLWRDGDKVRLKVNSNVVNAIQALKGVLDAPPSRASLESLRENSHLLEARVFRQLNAR